MLGRAKGARRPQGQPGGASDFVDRHGRYEPARRRGGGHLLQLLGFALALLAVWGLILWQAVDHARRQPADELLRIPGASGRGAAL
ncbi:MAG: hypothetical protein FJX68_00510 [Alphaproteobacteria bacterium]|nr:hypothetical protein [Alphaproteobacteria bacterium]